MKTLVLLIALASVVVVSNSGAQVPDPNHTVVRFDVFTGGTNFGKIDIELFDQEKPETVRNFLMYVYSGAYSNLILHRLVPNFVLQSGHAQVNDPSGSKNFLDAQFTVPTLGRIQNEHDTGPRIANDFGTIAMARIPGQTNSASSEWFINLANNASLNTTDGGFTVFGRVVNTMDARSGANLLNYFNTFQNAVNIRSFQIGDTGENFDIPVTEYHLDRFPLTREMFLVRASFLQGGVPRDHIVPTVQIKDPTSTTVIVTSNSSINFSGSAADNQEVARVIYDTRSDVGLSASGKENWSAEIALAPGTNRISFRAVDYFGNVSPILRRTILFSHPRSVKFQVEGTGKVTGIPNDQTFLVGVPYKLTAKPPANQYFLGWRANGGGIFSANRVLEFTMVEELTNLVAVFSRTFIGLTNGAYQGLFFPDTNGPPRSSGAISVNLAASGRYSGRLAPVGANYPVGGLFDITGYSEIHGKLGEDPLRLRLYLYPESIFGFYDDTHFLANVGLRHVKRFTRPAPQAGTFSFLISPIASVSGYGFGSATIDTRGKIKMKATLADGTAIKQTSALLVGDIWPLYASAKAGRKVILGYASFDANNAFHADLRWFDRDFPGNTNQVTRLDGSPYVPPSQGRLFNWTNGVMSLSGGGLQAAIIANLQLNDDGSFTFPSNPNNIQLSNPDANGMITGSFTHPVTSALTSFRGAVLQSSNIAAGFFLNGTDSGAFVIRGN